jgi:hypothetical protein
MKTKWVYYRRKAFTLALIMMLALIKVGLHCLGYRNFLCLLCAFSPIPQFAHLSAHAKLVARLVKRASELKSPNGANTCLHRSILLWWCLRWMGIKSELKTGIRSSETGRFIMHAWVEAEGSIINDRLDSVRQYTVLWRTLEPEKIVNYKMK